MIRILIGHSNAAPASYDTSRFELRCIQFGPDGRTPPHTIAEMRAQLPAGWIPDVYLHSSLGHFPIPSDIETFEGLTAACVTDWDRWGRGIWAGAGFFDLILSERRACDLLKAGGYENTHFCRVWSHDADIHRVLPEVKKDIDILFCGSLNTLAWLERDRWLERIARLSDRYNVVITTGHFGEDYVRLMNRAKIVFNRSVRGESNARAYEALACGALVFNEAENAELQEIFQDRLHCIYYNSANLEDLLAYYLANDEERERIIAAGRQVVLAEHSAEAHANAEFGVLEANLKTRYRPGLKHSVGERKMRMALQIYNSVAPALDVIAQLLQQAEREGYDPSVLLEASATTHGVVGDYAPQECRIDCFVDAIDASRRAVSAAPDRVMPWVTLGLLLLRYAELVSEAGAPCQQVLTEAIEVLEAAAGRCEALLAQEPSQTESGHSFGAHPLEGFGFPRVTDRYHCRIGQAYMQRGRGEREWEREVGANIIWKCRFLLSSIALANGRIDEALQQAKRAAHALPGEPEGWIQLVRCAAQAGRVEEAAKYCYTAIEAAPLHYALWLDLTTLLMAAGRRNEALAFVQGRLKLIKAIPPFASMRAALLSAAGMAETTITHAA